MSRGPDAATLLVRSLEADSLRAGCPVRMTESGWTRWASATFSGARHELGLEAPASAALDAWLEALPEADLPLRGHLVADIVVAGISRADGMATIAIEALTVEE
jgi:hypothetical protein